MKIVTTCRDMFFKTPSRHTNKGLNILTKFSWWNDYGDSYYRKGCNFKWF